MKILGLMLFAVATLTGYLLPKGDSDREPAFEIHCPEFTIIASPADKHLTVVKAHALAECLGDEEEMVCSIGTINLHRTKGDSK